MVVAISAMVIVVVSIAEVPVVPSRSEVSCAKHKVHGIAPKLMTECHHQESHLTSYQFKALICMSYDKKNFQHESVFYFMSLEYYQATRI